MWTIKIVREESSKQMSERASAKSVHGIKYPQTLYTITSYWGRLESEKQFIDNDVEFVNERMFVV